jgi:hypothetical protein
LDGNGSDLILNVLSWNLYEGAEENHRNLSKDRWSPNRGLKPRPPEYHGVKWEKKRGEILEKSIGNYSK